MGVALSKGGFEPFPSHTHVHVHVHVHVCVSRLSECLLHVRLGSQHDAIEVCVCGPLIMV